MILERLLVVDDDDATREAIADALRDEGLDVREARDGLEALERLRDDPLPDVIVLDEVMPGISGAEFRRRQLQDPRLASVPVVVATGQPLRASSELADLPRLQKPFGLYALVSTVRAGSAHRGERCESWRDGKSRTSSARVRARQGVCKGSGRRLGLACSLGIRGRRPEPAQSPSVARAATIAQMLIPPARRSDVSASTVTCSAPSCAALRGGGEAR